MGLGFRLFRLLVVVLVLGFGLCGLGGCCLRRSLGGGGLRLVLRGEGEGKRKCDERSGCNDVEFHRFH